MKELRRLIFILVSCMVLGIVSVSNLTSSQPMDRQSLKEDLADLESYTNEAQYIVRQYKADKITYVYTKNQIQYINKKGVSLFEELNTKQIPKAYQEDVKETHDNAAKLSQQLGALSNDKEKGKTLAAHEKALDDVKKDISRLQTKYE